MVFHHHVSLVSFSYLVRFKIGKINNHRHFFTGIELGHIAQGLQVAQFHQASQASTVSYGLPVLPSSTYGASSHFSNYKEPSILLPPPLDTSHLPNRLPSSFYGAPSHHSQTILLIQPRTPNLHSSYLPPRHHH